MKRRPSTRRVLEPVVGVCAGRPAREGVRRVPVMSLAVTLVHKAFAAFGLRVMRAEACQPLRCDVRFAADDRPRGLRTDHRHRCRSEHGAVGAEGLRRVSGRVRCISSSPRPLARPSCAAFASTRGSVEIHQTAITRPGRTSVRMTGATTGSTGAHVLGDDGTRGERGRRCPQPRWTCSLRPGGRLGPCPAQARPRRARGRRPRRRDGAAQPCRGAGHRNAGLRDRAKRKPHVRRPAWECSANAGLCSTTSPRWRPAARDGRLRIGDVIFVRDGSALIERQPMGLAPVRLTIVQTHPVQYNAPWFRHIAGELSGDRADRRLCGPAASRPAGRGLRSAVRVGHAAARRLRVASGARGHGWRRLRDRPFSRPRRSGHRRGGRGHAAGRRPRARLALRDVCAGVAVGAASRCADPVSRRHAQRRPVPPAGGALAWHVRTRAFLSLYSGYLSVGRLSREYLESHGVAPTRIFASPHAVDNDGFAASAEPYFSAPAARRRGPPAAAAPDDFVVLFAGKIEARKRPLDAVRAVASLGPNAVLAVAGWGDLEDRMRRRSRTAWRPHRVARVRQPEHDGPRLRRRGLPRAAERARIVGTGRQRSDGDGSSGGGGGPRRLRARSDRAGRNRRNLPAPATWTTLARRCGACAIAARARPWPPRAARASPATTSTRRRPDSWRRVSR